MNGTRRELKPAKLLKVSTAANPNFSLPNINVKLELAVRLSQAESAGPQCGHDTVLFFVRPLGGDKCLSHSERPAFDEFT